MNKEEILRLGELLGCTAHVAGGTKSILLNCPLSPWTHNNKADRHPSCAIFIEPDDISIYKCFTCGNKGIVTDLVEKVNRLRGGGLEDVLVWVEKVNHPDLHVRLERAQAERPDAEVVHQDGGSRKYRTFGEEDLARFQGRIPKYVLLRGIQILSCKRWGLGYDKSEDDPRLIFPVRDYAGSLVGIVGRTIREGTEPRYKNYWGFNKSGFLYGEHLLSYDSEKTIVLVEGMLDPIAVTQVCDCDCVAQMGTDLSPVQREKIIGFCGTRPLVIMYDGDKPGHNAARKTREQLKDRIVVYTARLPEKTDPAQFAKENPELLKEVIKIAGIYNE